MVFELHPLESESLASGHITVYRPIVIMFEFVTSKSRKPSLFTCSRMNSLLLHSFVSCLGHSRGTRQTLQNSLRLKALTSVVTRPTSLSWQVFYVFPCTDPGCGKRLTKTDLNIAYSGEYFGSVSEPGPSLPTRGSILKLSDT